MKKIDQLFISEAERFVENLLQEKLPDHFYYHNFTHAMAVKSYVEMVGKACNVTEEELNLLRLSALFHDTGFIKSIESHVEHSIEIATEFLTAHQIDRESIDCIVKNITATKMPQNPTDRLSKIICDADLMYIAEDNCYEYMEAMYEESMARSTGYNNRNLFDLETIHFFSTHKYFTEYGQNILQPKKANAEQMIIERMKRREARKSKKGIVMNGEKKTTNYSRGVETLLRLTARNQINLNSIADNKSNILISVNAIVISIIITMLVGNFSNINQNIYPIVILLIVCLTTIILAILSTRPNVKWGKFTKEDLEEKKIDLIYFGNFINMDCNDYQNAVMGMMENDDDLYNTMIKNQYSLGIILGKKFRLVKLAYNVFMIGISVTVISFLISILS